MPKYLLSFLLIYFMVVTPSWAQETEGLGNYVPPPLFGSPNLLSEDNKADDIPSPTPPKEKTAPVDETELEKPKEPVVIKHLIKKEVPVEKIFKDVEPPTILPKPVDKPKPPIKPKAGTPKKKKQEEKKINVNSGPEPIDLLDKKDIPKPPPIYNIDEPPAPKFEAPKNTEGVVKGPKTMPSYKKQSVESEVLYEPEEEKPSRIMERLKTQNQETEPSAIKSPKEIETIKTKMSLPSFDQQADGSKKLAMLYIDAQSEVKEPQINSLEQIIVPHMLKQPSSKLLIKAYASSQDDSINSARRLALSRALSVRDYLLNKQIEANRIDVRALGAETNVQPLDRVELVLVP